jgi:vacuolar-type H+-ATPase subunit E/Vma4
MIKLLEENVELLCRNKEEVGLVRELIPECQKAYSQLMKEKTDRDYATKLSVIPDKYMTEAQGSEVGGIVLLAHERRIVVANSLQDRIQLCFEQQLPQIRRQLFPS